MKRMLFPMLLFGSLVFLLFFPQLSVTYAKAGLMLWFYTLLPSLFPFLILSGILLQSNVLYRFLEKPKSFWKKVFALSPNGAYALLMGICCGYPMGAKITADLYREQRISHQEASYLLAFSSHPGPSFLSAYLCTGLLEQTNWILPTYGIVYASSFLCSLFFRPGSISETEQGPFLENKKEAPALSYGEILDASMMNAFTSITKLGGYIILFSMLQGIFTQLFASHPLIHYFLLGFTEVSTGISAIAQNPWSLSVKYPLMLGFTAFGGLCVTAQTKSMLAGTDLSLQSYCKGKLFCGICAAALGALFVKIVEVVVI